MSFIFAVKNILAILSAIVVFASCSDRAGGWHSAPELRTAHELMQEQPDSALKVLVGFDIDDSTNRSVVNEYQILVAEALYKNYCQQTNAPAVTAATAYYDSVFEKHPKNSGLAFETARAHYYKAVGETEDDDIVAACTDYLKAADIMEEAFPEIAKAAEKGMMTECNYEKTRFMALIYYRLGEMFYSENDGKSAIGFYKSALKYSSFIEDTILSANLFRNIGHSFYMNGFSDSALVYYNDAMVTNPSTDCVENMIAEIYHDKGFKDTAYYIMRNLLKNEKSNVSSVNSYELGIGNMFYADNIYDSALYHLDKCFASDSRYIRLSAAKMLSAIHDSLGNHAQKAYFSDFYSKNIEKELDRTSKSKSLIDSYNRYKNEKHLNYQRHRNTMYAVSVSVSLFVAFVIWLGFHVRRNKKHTTEISDKNKIISRYENKTAELEHRHEAMMNSVKAYSGNDADKCLSEFGNQNICITIKKRMEDSRISTKNLSSCKGIALSDCEKTALRNAAKRCIPGLTETLSSVYGVKGDNTVVCCLCLLDMTTAEIAALTEITYQGAYKRINSIKKALKTEENVKDFLTNHIYNLYN
ncbi:MAG: hypothetical protein Q4F69_01155 [Bacteroidia bacterium]|nr:hypothetical protein [Bacteroidia bacterium]